MNVRVQIMKFGTAVLFLLAILLQPIHQLEHINHNESHIFEHESKVTTVQNHHEIHCNLCDFIFSPTIELTIHHLEIPFEFNFSEFKIESRIFSFYFSNYQFNKQLRAPPYFV